MFIKNIMLIFSLSQLFGCTWFCPRAQQVEELEPNQITQEQIDEFIAKDAKYIPFEVKTLKDNIAKATMDLEDDLQKPLPTDSNLTQNFIDWLGRFGTCICTRLRNFYVTP